MKSPNKQQQLYFNRLKVANLYSIRDVTLIKIKVSIKADKSREE